MEGSRCSTIDPHENAKNSIQLSFECGSFLKSTQIRNAKRKHRLRILVSQRIFEVQRDAGGQNKLNPQILDHIHILEISDIEIVRSLDQHWIKKINLFSGVLQLPTILEDFNADTGGTAFWNSLAHKGLNAPYPYPFLSTFASLLIKGSNTS